MARVRSSDTGPERKVRRALFALGARFRLQRADLPGRPDIVLPGRRLAVFVNGCFWHGHDCPRGRRAPKANADYWRTKIARNRARDLAALTQLNGLGWTAETVWECETRDAAALETRLRSVLARAPFRTPRQAAP